MTSAVLYKDLTATRIIHYDDRENLAVRVLTAQTLFAIIIDIILIIAFCRQRWQTMAIDTMFILSNVVADFVFALVVLIFCVFLVSGQGWWMGQIGCLFSAVSLIVSIALSILSVVGLTAYRYFSIIYKKQFTQQHAIGAIASIWIIIPMLVIIFVFLPGFLENTVALQPSRLYCALSWWNTDHPSSIAAVYICLLVIFLSISFILFAYTHICIKYHQMRRSKAIHALPTTLKNSSDLVIFVQISSKEWLLIKKALLISLSFVLAWFPYCIKIVIEVATGEPSSYSYDVYTAWIACLNTILNACILYMYDGKTRVSVIELFSFLSPWFRRKSSAASSSPHTSQENQSNAPNTPLSPTSPDEEITILSKRNSTQNFASTIKE